MELAEELATNDPAMSWLSAADFPFDGEEDEEEEDDEETVAEAATAPPLPWPAGCSIITRSAIRFTSLSALRRTLMRRFGLSNDDLDPWRRVANVVKTI